jgi:hypothetical protein
MTLLPIVDRELRVASRKRSTFWVRIAAALAGMIIGMMFMFLSLLGGAAGASMGSTLFNTLTWISLATALATGLFFTSDCLSEEKRDGTLGFLFLTDLRGYDIVGGKLLATSLRGFFALLAIYPVLAITLLMGGVTGGQFWKTSLALTNALFCSLSAGMLASAMSRDAQRSLGTTLCLLIFFLGAGPLVDWGLAEALGRPFRPLASLTSPGYAFVRAGAWGGGAFWDALAVSHLAGWLCLGIASWVVPRAWQEKGRQNQAVASPRTYRLKYGGEERRLRLRRKLLDRNPVQWLACRERGQSLGLWILALLLLGGAIAGAVLRAGPEVWMFWSVAGAFITMVLYLWAASQSCRFYVDARRSGMIELLLAAPVSVAHVIQGVWSYLLRGFGLPVLIILSVNLAGAVMAHQSTWGNLANPQKGAYSALISAVIAGVAGVVQAGANLWAISWFGMWMGMTSKNLGYATLKTLLFVQVIPALVISFSSGILSMVIIMPKLMSAAASQSSTAGITIATFMPVLMTVVPAVLSVAKDVGFFFWAREKLHRSFRDQATRTYAPLHVYPARAATPPIISPPIPK